MRLSVLVTTFGRRAYLQGCIESLLVQTRRPDEIVIVTRTGDAETEEYVSGLISSHDGGIDLRHARVSEPGVLAANRAGLAKVTGEILSFIDDDATARPDWLERIESHFEADPTLGGVGGRDLQHTSKGIVDEPADVVCRILWYGRIIGNNHKAFSGTAHVDHLKGVNMSFRRALIIPFDTRILGNAHYYEMDLCFGVRHQGYCILYDGDLIVDHYIEAPRYLPGNRDFGDPEREFFTQHNRVYVMMKNLGFVRRVLFLFYTFIVDGVSCLLKLARGSDGMRPDVLGAMLRGKIAGLRDFLAAPRRRRGETDHVARSKV